MMQRPPPEDFSLKETRPHLGGGKLTGDKLTSTYDLVEQMQYLYVRVVKAKELPGKDLTGSCDPYVEVKLGNYKGTTRHFEKKSNPEWNQVFAFSKDRIQASFLEATVKDKSPVRLVAAYHIATAGFIGVSRRTQRSDAAAAAGSCVNETNKS